LAHHLMETRIIPVSRPLISEARSERSWFSCLPCSLVNQAAAVQFSRCRDMISVFLLALSFTACCHYPRGRAKYSPVASATTPSLTIVAYGDTRTGPFGLGDNARQAVHGKIVDDIFRNDGSINAVIFTGDAVMSNFFAWRSKYWKCFLSQSNRFVASGIDFYPALGNHEVLPSIVPALKTTSAEATGFVPNVQRATATSIQEQLSRAYDMGEEPRTPITVRQTAPVEEEVDFSTASGLRTVKKWEAGINRGDVLSANKFGQSEHHLQFSFYKLPRDERCHSDADTFRTDYLDRAKYGYLRPLLQGSYYAKVLQNGPVRLKLIALDTNCLDSQSQQDFFASEVRGFDGPIIVFGHHPPVDYSQPGASWDLVPGWGETEDQYMKRYLTFPEGKKVVLWIFGHVHNYQRRGPSGEGADAISPVLLIAGGGGASLDQAPAGFQWQPSSWHTPFYRAEYSQVRVAVTPTNIGVVVRGADNISSEFKVIESFTIPLAAASWK